MVGSDDSMSFQASEMDVCSVDNEVPLSKKVRRSAVSHDRKPRILRIPSEISDKKCDSTSWRLPLAIRNTQVGSVFVCGMGDCGQLGLGEDILECTKPKLLKSLENEEIVDVYCGGMHAVALAKGGKVWCWGNNDQCALGRSGEEMVPDLVTGLENEKISHVSCSDSATLFLSDHGKAYLCGCFRTIDGLLGATREVQILREPKTLLPMENVNFVSSDAGSGAQRR